MKTQHSWNPSTSLQRPRGESSRETEGWEPKHDHRCALQTHSRNGSRSSSPASSSSPPPPSSSSIVIIIIIIIIMIVIIIIITIIIITPTVIIIIIIIIITVITIRRAPASSCTTELVSRVYSRVGFRVYNRGTYLLTLVMIQPLVWTPRRWFCTWVAEKTDNITMGNSLKLVSTLTLDATTYNPHNSYLLAHRHLYSHSVELHSTSSNPLEFRKQLIKGIPTSPVIWWLYV